MNKVEIKTPNKREKEKGAALVMALLMSFLLLAAAGGLLLETSLGTANVTDATAEQQAYNAAESGIQSAVNVFRGNVILSDANRIDTSKPATDKANKIDFVKAITQQYSNLSTSGLDATPRLSRWLSYESGTYADRVKLADGAYSVFNGDAYSLAILDPDHTGTIVSYSTRGILYNCDHISDDPDLPCADVPPLQQVGYPHKTWDDGNGNRMRITYIPKTVYNQDVSSAGNPNVDFGFFKVEIQGNGAAMASSTRFEIIVNMTVPYRAQRVMRGWIEQNAAPYTTPPKIIFDSQTYTLQGSIINLGFNGGSFVNFPNLTPQRVGYEANMTAGSPSANTVITGTMSPPEPVRLLIRSTGYGPRGAKKQLEAIIQKNFFNGLTAPATLTLVGGSCGPCPGTTFTFNPGSSNVTTYSGDDAVSTDIIPPIGTLNGDNLDDVNASVNRQPPHPFNGNVVGTPSDVSNEVPDWLSSPSQMDIAVKQLYNTALSSPDPGGNSTGRYFPSGTQPTTFGNNTTALGITFCDGNCTFTGNGGGILVVTGTLTLHGNFNFNGLIIVTGSGGIQRSGGGTGILQGNIVVAPYENNRIADNLDPSQTAQFLAPQYDLSGGGNSTIQYNSSSVANGLTAVSNFVLGVAEK
jgi:hypothetical protein